MAKPGFGQLGVKSAREAKVDKVLIYRYFENSLLLQTFAKEGDYNG